MLFNAEQVAEILNLPKARIYDLARENVLPCVRIGRTVRFHPNTIEKFIANGGQTPEPENAESQSKPFAKLKLVS